MRARRGAAERGFTLVEMMVVLAVLGVLAAVAFPRVSRDRGTRSGPDFANGLARDLQRARSEAIASRLPIRAFFYGDRVELRSAVAGATPGAAPRAATTADPILRLLTPPGDLSLWSVLPTAAAPPAAATLSSTVFATVEFNVLGQAQLVGSPLLTSAFVYVSNARLPVTVPGAQMRIDVNALTGFVTVWEGGQ